MNTNYAIVVNTHSSSRDVLDLFLIQLEKYYPNNKLYIFTDNSDGLDSKYTPIIYNSNDMFRTQYLQCIEEVSEKFILYLNEDYILYDNVNVDKINDYLSILEENPEFSFIRLARGPNFTNDKFNNELYFLTHKQPHFYSQTAAIWRTDSIKKIHEIGPDLHIGAGGAQHGHFEVAGNDLCRELNMIGLSYYSGEAKRGMYHYDTDVFPYIATAIIKGKWNKSEYPKELLPLLDEYNIDIKKRGYI